ncbi:hypothetical protein HanIR_Chr13g0630481 [Helianthus annuus]|nr:hypothetical protein HanIR_Chr13g0630481 [Helianthus annuus]
MRVRKLTCNKLTSSKLEGSNGKNEKDGIIKQKLKSKRTHFSVCVCVSTCAKERQGKNP